MVNELHTPRARSDAQAMIRERASMVTERVGDAAAQLEARVEEKPVTFILAALVAGFITGRIAR